MAATPEAKVKAEAVKIFKRKNAYYFFPGANGYGRAGIPDAIVCYKGRFLGVEFKAGKNTTTALQDREIAAIHAAGGAAMVINETNLHSLEEWFDECPKTL